MPGSPLYRCIACAFERAHNRPSAKSSPPMPTVEAAPAGGGSHANDSSRVPCRGGTLTACVGARPAAARETFCAACLGSALDLDHFLAAGSLRLSRATGLAERPWGHSLAALVVAVRSIPRPILTVFFMYVVRECGARRYTMYLHLCV